MHAESQGKEEGTVMTIEFDELVDDTVTSGNSKQVNDYCEPNLMQHLNLERWMVIRALVAWGLLCEEQQRQEMEEKKEE